MSEFVEAAEGGEVVEGEEGGGRGKDGEEKKVSGGGNEGRRWRTKDTRGDGFLVRLYTCIRAV